MRSAIELRGSGPEFSRTDLDQLEHQLNAWRGNRTARVRLPSELWDSAARLAGSLGVSQVSRRLRLDYYKLSRWLGQSKRSGQDLPPSAFVELAVADRGSLGASQEFKAELGEAGSNLTLHLGRDVSAVVALAEAFWRRKP